MFFPGFSDRNSPVHSLDPRARIVVCLVFAFLLAFSGNFIVCSSFLAISIFLTAYSGIHFRDIKGRLYALNIFIVFIFLTVPFSPELNSSGWHYSTEEFRKCFLTAMRSNAILLMATSLINTIDLVSLGYSAEKLKIPPKMVFLLLFTVRYIDIIHGEYCQMKRAMKARGFVPGVNTHTYKSLSTMAASLILRSMDRAERVNAAMKCRCFKGTFYVLKDFSFGFADILFVSISFIIFSFATACEILG